MARGLVAILLALLAVVVAGCGEANESSPETSFTAEEVSDHFEEETGAKLFRKQGGGDPAWEQLGLDENPPPELVERYGTFSIYVVKPGHQDAMASLLRDKATGKPLPHRRGIYWELDTQSDTWIAHTRYANIVLVWFTEERDPAVDARWQRLHRVLRALTA